MSGFTKLKMNFICMKSISSILIVICFLTAFSANVFAEFPTISEAIETRLYKGTPEDIISFGKNRQLQIGQLLSEAEALLEQTVNQSEKEKTEDAINIFKGIKFQFQRLESELKRTGDLTIKKYRDSFGEKLIKSWNNTKSVLYYPLFVVGETNITLASIFKLIILLIAGIVMLKLIRRKTSAVLYKKTKLSKGSVNSITTLGYYISLVIGILVILATVGIDLTQVTVLVGALGVGIGFGMQTIANNFISGIILLIEQSIKSGDIVMLEGGLTGEVKKVAIRATIIRTVNGDDIIVPNSEFVSGRVNSWTYSDDWRRLEIPFGVSYDSDPDEIVKLATEAAREVENTAEDTDHPIRIFFNGFGDNSLDFSIRVWCRMTNLRIHSGLRSDYYFVLFRKLKKAGVLIPFPQRDLHLQSVSPELLTILKKNSEDSREK